MWLAVSSEQTKLAHRHMPRWALTRQLQLTRYPTAIRTLEIHSIAVLAEPFFRRQPWRLADNLDAAVALQCDD